MRGTVDRAAYSMAEPGAPVPDESPPPMTRATPVIAAVGSALLIIAIATAAIRGADEGIPSADPTTPAATTPADPDPTTPEPTEDPTDPEPTEDPTAPEPTDGPTDPEPTEDPTTDPSDPDDGDVDDDGDDLPETGGGALAVLGIGLAAAAAAVGRRRG
jgi:hypothetical protein